MKKRWISAILVALMLCNMCVMLFPTKAHAATDYSEYTIQLRSASSGGASAAICAICDYFNYQWWEDLEYYSGYIDHNDRFQTRLRFEKDATTGKYRLYYIGVRAYNGQLYTVRCYLSGETWPTDYRTEYYESLYGFYYGDVYGYDYITLSTSSADALLWEVTSSGYLKTTYKGTTRYMWTTRDLYGKSANYVFRLRSSTTAKGDNGIPVDLDNAWFDLNNSYHVHTPGEKQVVSIEPGTCTKMEVTTYALYCTDETCGVQLASTSDYGSKDPDNHVEILERVGNETPANCQTPYTYYKETYCTGCNKVITSDGPFQEGEALGHDLVLHEANAPTCTETGWEAYEACSRCDYSTYVELPAAGHNYSDWVVESNATCTEEGVLRRDCQECDHFETSTFPENGHNYTAVVTVPTCTEQGYTTHTCSDCGDSYMDAYMPETGHSFGEWYVVTEAGCTEDGLQRRDCANCEHYETEAIAATGHDYQAVVTAPTCTEQGYTTHTCSGCGDSYMDTYVPETGHSFGQWYVEVDATCTKNGLNRRDCQNCDHYETSTFPETGHSLGEWYVEVDATCTENGRNRRDCQNCDYYETYITSAKGHEYSAVVTEPTCTEGGYTTHTCANCGSSYADAYVPAAGHSFGQWYVETKATCTEDGQLRRDCSNCGDHESVAVPATGHNYTSVVTEPTCTEQGYTTHTCHCGDSYIDSYEEALGHSYSAWYIVTNATCTEDGQMRHDCQNCDDYETETVAAPGHNHVVTDSKDATCTEVGYITYTCECGDTYTEETPVIDHNFVDGVCTGCGEKTYILGDVNGDGQVDTTDAKLVMQYDLGLVDKTALILVAADVNGDGNVDTTDAKLIMQLDLGLIDQFPGEP